MMIEYRLFIRDNHDMLLFYTKDYSKALDKYRRTVTKIAAVKRGSVQLEASVDGGSTWLMRHLYGKA